MGFIWLNIEQLVKNQCIVYVMNVVFVVGMVMVWVKEKLCQGVLYLCENIKSYVDDVVKEIQVVELLGGGLIYFVFSVN